ncbi:MAG: type I methionyl aminopeptidase [Propionibacteriaceae bacterium]|jgi:methionyl aminopeptidase|nr:type I methionyl aminopeptidase [Propionibacteriaceae bacterium]
MSRIQLKTPEQIIAMRQAGLVVQQGLAEMSAAVAPGVTTAEIDAVGRAVLAEAGAKSSFFGYGAEWGITPYPGVACISPNEVVVHGIPDGRVLADGDIVSIDFGAILGGWHGDAARTVAVGSTVSAETAELIAVTRKAAWTGIAALWSAAQVSDVSNAIQRYVEKQPRRYGIVRGYTGHGIGTEMHMSPDIPNHGRPGRGPRVLPGMVVCIEPMLTLGKQETVELDDDWTVVTRDSSPAAHWENTVAVLEDGLWVLTEPDGGAAELAARGVPLAGIAS